MPDENEEKRMHRLSDTRPELKRFAPLSKDEEDAQKPLEQTWGPEEIEPVSKAQRRWTLIWVGTLAASILVGTIVVAKWRGNQTDSAETDPETTRQLTTAERRTLIEEILTEFFSATETAGRLEHILQPERLRPMVADYYTNQNPVEIEFRSLGKLHFVTLDDHPWCFAAFEDSHEKPHLAAFKEVDNSYRLDWESFVGYGELSWERFIQSRPEQPTQMRAYLSQSNYNNHKYADPEVYVAYKLRPSVDGRTLYGYALRGSPLQIVLSTVAKPGERQPVNLLLRCEPDAGADNLVIIEKFLHPKWTNPTILRSGS